MSDLDEHSLIEALQCLDLLPPAQTAAEPALKRALRLIESTKEEIRCPKDKPIEGKEPRRETDESIVSHRAFERLRGRRDAAERFGPDDPDRDDVRAAIAIGEIRDIARATNEHLAESESTPRRAEVRDLLILLATHGRALSTALKSPYVEGALDRELAIEAGADKRTGKRRQRHTIRSLLELGRIKPYRAIGHLIHVVTILAERALERRVPLVAGDHLEYGRPYFEDRGGDGKADSIDRLPLKQGHFMRCLGLFGQYRSEIASGSPDGPFVKFTQKVWLLATGEEESLEGVARDMFKAIHSGNASPVLLTALVDLPDSTLPPRKTRRKGPRRMV